MLAWVECGTATFLVFALAAWWCYLGQQKHEVLRLTHAITSADCAEIELLLMEGADLDSVRSCTGEPGVIAVVKAALDGKCGHESAARVIGILLSRGAEVDERGTEWKSALIHAAASGDTELCDLLLRYGADATSKDVFGRTAADWAERGGYRSIAASLRRTPYML